MQRSVLAAGLAAGLLASTTASAQPNVVASILPLHGLAAAVMDGVGEPELLLPAGASPHAYSFRPSDAARLERADLVLWVGEDMERFLERPIQNLAGSARVLELAEAPGVTLLPLRSGGAWADHDHDDDHDHADDHDHDHAHAHDDDHDHDHAHAHDDDHDHDHDHAHDGDDHDHAHGDHGHGGHAHAHGEFDLHLWLAPDNAKAMTRAIARTLAELDPDHADLYAANAEATIERLSALEGELEEVLAPVRDEPFIVFHDAYQYFEQAFGLNAVGSVTVSPEVQPGTAQLAALRQQVEEAGATCVFSEPQFEPRLVVMLTDGTPARTGVLDPLGVELVPGPDAYPQLLRNLATAMVECLGGG